MKCIILAAGYATRMYPLTEHFPKPLLRVGNKTILDWLCDDLYENAGISDFTVISNHKFVGFFHRWAQNKKYEVSIVDDGTRDNSTRLGAVGDIAFAHDECYIDEDCLVLAGDNMMDFSLKDFVEYSKNCGTSCVMYYQEDELQNLQRTAVITINDEGVITSYEEKPENPKSNLAVPPFYFFKKEDFCRASEAISEGCNKDAPGSFAAWLSTKVSVHAHKMPGKRFDIGNIENYQAIRRIYEGEMADQFTRNLDKTLIPTCNIMGVDIASIDMNWLLDFTRENIKYLSGDYLCVSNVHTTVTAYEDEEYRKVQNGGIMAIPDGGPLSTVGRRRGYRAMSRTTGPSYMGEILDVSEERGYKHFFYGSTEETLEKLKSRLDRDYPNLEIVGMYSPPFRQMTDNEDDDIVKLINEANPDFIWVGLGAPKQEIWMAKHIGRVNGFMIGVGAGFDYLAGNIRRAPEWMQNRNLEWFYRLLQDPKRLFRRYLTTNTKFIVEAMIKGK